MDAIEKQDQEIKIGGPGTLTYNQIARMAFAVLGAEPKITYMPGWAGGGVLKLVKLVMGNKTYGPIKFFLTVLGMDMVAPEYGKHTLNEFFTEMKQKDEEQDTESEEQEIEKGEQE